MIESNVLIRRKLERECRMMEIEGECNEKEERETEKKGRVKLDRRREVLMNEKETYKKSTMRSVELEI